MIRGLMGLLQPGDQSLPTPFRTPAQTPAQSPDKSTSTRKWEPPTPASRHTSLTAAPAAAPSDPPAPSQATASAPTAAAPALAPAPTRTQEHARLAAFLNLNANSKIPPSSMPAMHKTQSTPPVSRSGNQSRRASMRAPPPTAMPSSLKDGTQSRSQSRVGRRISFDADELSDKEPEALKGGERDFLPDGNRRSGESKISRPRSDSGSRAVAHTPDLKRKSSLVIDTSVNGDDFDGFSEADHGSNGVLSRSRPRIQWASFLPPLASVLSNPDNFSSGVATGRLFGLIHTRLGERRMATPMLLLAGAFLSAVGGDATGSRLSALRLDEALSTAAMIEAFLQSAMLAELSAPASAAPPSNFSGKLAEARGTAVSAHTRVRSNVNVLRDVLNRHLMSTVQRHSSKLAQEVFGMTPNVIDVLERTRSTCVRAGLTLTLWRAVALAYLAEVYIAILHHLLKLRNDGYTAGHRQACKSPPLKGSVTDCRPTRPGRARHDRHMGQEAGGARQPGGCDPHIPWRADHCKLLLLMFS